MLRKSETTDLSLSLSHTLSPTISHSLSLSLSLSLSPVNMPTRLKSLFKGNVQEGEEEVGHLSFFFFSIIQPYVCLFMLFFYLIFSRHNQKSVTC